jgi:RNA polymerase sigma factor (sigma-70 family)
VTEPVEWKAPLGKLTAEQQRLVAQSVIVPQVARKVRARYRELDLDELVAIGQLALVRLAARYDASRGVAFDGYAWQHVHFQMIKACHAARRQRLIGWEPATRAVHAAVAGLRDEGDVLADTDEEQRRQVQEIGDSVAAAAFCGFAASAMLQSPEDGIAARELHARAIQVLQEALRDMPERERRLIELRYFEGRQFEEIAADLGAGTSTVRRHHQEALGMLGRRLQRRGVLEPPPAGADG